MKKYYITNEQYHDLIHYKDMFEHFASQTQGICNQERPLIEYGFHLGELHTGLRTKYMELMETLDVIHEQIIEGEKNEN